MPNIDKQNILCWVDIPVLDLGRAIDFYSAVLAERVMTMESEDHVQFGLLPISDVGVWGALRISTADNSPSKTGPLIYISAWGRLDDAAAEAVKHGGKELVAKYKIGAWGFCVIILDSEGNRVGLHSPEP
jgi:hypothetical protein